MRKESETEKVLKHVAKNELFNTSFMNQADNFFKQSRKEYSFEINTE